MSRANRLGLLALAAAVIVAAFIVLRPDGSDEASRPSPDERQAPGTAGGGEPDRAPRSRRVEPVPVLEAGRVKTIAVPKGEQVRLAVRSRTDEEVHVHGYDIVRAAPAGRTVRLRFLARLEGVFEIELERSGEQIGRLRVEP